MLIIVRIGLGLTHVAPTTVISTRNALSTQHFATRPSDSAPSTIRVDVEISQTDDTYIHSGGALNSSVHEDETYDVRDMKV